MISHILEIMIDYVWLWIVLKLESKYIHPESTASVTAALFAPIMVPIMFMVMGAARLKIKAFGTETTNSIFLQSL